MRDGWADIEIVARVKEKYFKVAKKKQIAVALAILKGLDLVSKEITLKDIDVKLPRNKNDNLQTKAQSYATIVATKTVAPEDALNIADMTTDTTEVIRRGEEYWNKKQEELDARMQKQQDINTSNANQPNKEDKAKEE